MFTSKYIIKKYHDISYGNRLILKLLRYRIYIESNIILDHIIINNVNYYNYPIINLKDIETDYISYIKYREMKAYFKDGYFHNENGYAYQNFDQKLYIINGDFLTEKEFKQKSRKVKFKSILND